MHDHLGALLLIVASVVALLLWLALSLAKVAKHADSAARHDRPLPGDLGSSPWPELEEAEARR